MKKIFNQIVSESLFTSPSIDICRLISKNGLKSKRNEILSILNEADIKYIKDYNENFLSIIITYIEISLIDNAISQDEYNNIKFLKLLFSINEGDFLKYKSISEKVALIIKQQMSLIYEDDNKIDFEESIHKVKLQEIFGLGYDDFLLLSKDAVLKAIQRGGKLSELDTFINKESDSKSD